MLSEAGSALLPSCAKRLARIQAQLNNAVHHMNWKDERLKKMVEERDIAREELNITPAGLAILKRRADGGQEYLEAEYNKYAVLREERLKAMRESKPNSVESLHEDASSKLKEAYAALGITYDFDTTNSISLSMKILTNEFSKRN